MTRRKRGNDGRMEGGSANVRSEEGRERGNERGMGGMGGMGGEGREGGAGG